MASTEDLAQRFKALSEAVRLRILGLLLRHGELCVCEFERFLGVSQSKASRHLRYLLNAGLIEDRRDGLWVYYRLREATDEQHRLLLATLRELLEDLALPDITSELEAMRSERCRPLPWRR
jgi:ArsR family transcriptional regulator